MLNTRTHPLAHERLANSVEEPDRSQSEGAVHHNILCWKRMYVSIMRRTCVLGLGGGGHGRHRAGFKIIGRSIIGFLPRYESRRFAQDSGLFRGPVKKCEIRFSHKRIPSQILVSRSRTNPAILVISRIP